MNEKWKNLPASCMLKAVFWLFTAAFLVAALVSPDRAEMFSGLQAIYTTPAQVTKDYFEVGSVSAAFMNAFLVSALCAGLYMLPGAVANGLKEKNVNLVIGKAAAAELERHDVEVMLSRTSDITEGTAAKVKECNAFKPDLAGDIHNNAGGGDGAEVYHTINGGTGKELAESDQVRKAYLGG